MACPYAGKVALNSCPHRLSNKTMKAIVVEKHGGPEVLKYRIDMPIPAVGNNQVLIKVMTVGVNPCDVLVRENLVPGPPPPPFIPGGDLAGYVESVGKDVTRVQTGDPVYTLMWNFNACHAYAEYSVCEEYEVFPLPTGVNFSQGAALGMPYFTAYRALFQRAHAKAGETVLVHGASGACGLACCQIARAYGLKVLGTAGTSQGMDLVLRNGGHAAFNHNEDGYIDNIKSYIGECNINLFMEMAAHKNLSNDIVLAAQRARIAIIGGSGRCEIDPAEITYREIHILGIEGIKINIVESLEIAAALRAGSEQGWLKPVIGDEFPLSEAAQAQVEVMTHPNGARGKIILSVT